MTARKVLLLIEVAMGLGPAVLALGVISLFWIPGGFLFLLASGEWRPLLGALLFFPGLYFLFKLVALALTDDEDWCMEYFFTSFSVFIFGNVCLISAFLEGRRHSLNENMFLVYIPIAVIIHLFILVRHHYLHSSKR